MPNQELQCPFCPKTSSRGTGLASHIRGAHPKQYAGWSRDRKRGGKTGAVHSSSKATEAAGGLQDVIARLESQRASIERALSALREVDGLSTAPAAAAPGPPVKAKRKGRLSPDGRARLVAALKKRWAAKKAQAASPAKRGRPKKIA